MRDIAIELKSHNRERRNQISIAAQHAIATSIAPELIRGLTSDFDVNVRLRSANHDGCRALLMTRQCDMTIVYREAVSELEIEDEHVEAFVLGSDLLVPVIASQQVKDALDALDRGEVRLVAYPTDVFLGQVMAHQIFPKLHPDVTIQKRTETALTLAAIQLSLAGVGIAWVPLRLAQAEIFAGRLTSLAGALPFSELSVVVQRLTGRRTEIEDRVWDAIRAHSQTVQYPVATETGARTVDRAGP
jgi:DNA-binding transcriptional LysR family regulator